MQDPFYMVQGNGPSRVRHSDLASARREANRLARANPGNAFFVMAAVEGFVKDDVRRIEIRDDDVLIPF